MKLGEKLSKKEKQDWLDSLKSGRYTACAGRLERGLYKNCCLGVLSIVLEDVIERGGRNVKNNSTRSPYKLIEMGYSRSIKQRLYSVNDVSVDYEGLTDYSKVIPIIEQLETRD